MASRRATSWARRPLADTVAKIVDVVICALIVRPQQESHFVWRDYARGLSDGVRPLNQISSRPLRNWLRETGKLVLQQYRPIAVDQALISVRLPLGVKQTLARATMST
jgi:hypothetical protein